MNFYKVFMYKMYNYELVVGLVKGVYIKDNLNNKVREYVFLVFNRFLFVIIFILGKLYIEKDFMIF